MHLKMSVIATILVSALYSLDHLLLLLSNRERLLISTPILDRRSELLRLTTAAPPITIKPWHIRHSTTNALVMNYRLLPCWGCQVSNRAICGRICCPLHRRCSWGGYLSLNWGLLSTVLLQYLCSYDLRCNRLLYLWLWWLLRSSRLSHCNSSNPEWCRLLRFMRYSVGATYRIVTS